MLLISVLLTKDFVVSVFTTQKMVPVKYLVLDLKPTEKEYKVTEYSGEGDFCTHLEKLTPLLEVINAVETVLERYVVPL